MLCAGPVLIQFHRHLFETDTVLPWLLCPSADTLLQGPDLLGGFWLFVDFFFFVGVGNLFGWVLFFWVGGFFVL